MKLGIWHEAIVGTPGTDEDAFKDYAGQYVPTAWLSTEVQAEEFQPALEQPGGCSGIFHRIFMWLLHLFGKELPPDER
jgi:hypothetical protein